MMMKNKDHLTLIAFGFILVIIIFFIPNANAQVGKFQISAPQIKDPPKCSQVDISGNKAYLPFQIKVFHEFSRVNNINFEQLGSSIPNTHTSPELMIFDTSALDDYQVFVEVNHDSDKIRAVYIEYWSQNTPSHKEIISYEGLTFCRTFNVKTAEAPVLPTREELIGEQAQAAFEEMPLIKNAINSNTSALNSSIIWMFMVVVAALAVSAGQFFAYVGRRRKDKKRGTAFDNMIKVGAKYISGFKKEHDELKKQRVEEKKELNQFLDMANVEFRSFLVDLRKGARLPVKSSLDIGNVRTVEEEAEQTSILRKLYQSTSDQQLSKLLNFFKDKSSKLAKRHVTAITEESEKREKPKEITSENPKDESLDVEGADEVIKEYAKERYRNLNDSKLRLLYRAFDTKYRNDPQEKYSNRLYKISEVINLRAKERVDSRKRDQNNGGEEK